MSELIDNLALKSAERWKAAKLTRRAEYVHPNFGPVPRIIAAQNRYELIQAQTGVHWSFVASTHYREANLNFACQLAQGDDLHKTSHNVPAGRGPFPTFEAGAYDALVVCQPRAASNPIWHQSPIMPAMLVLLEMYNGLGYARKGLPSPYVWSGTDQYTKGKYIADGVFDPNTVDKQLGVAGILVCLLEAQPALFGPVATPIAPTPPKPLPVPPSPSQGPSTSVPSGPIINKAGEDITDLLEHFAQNVWEWLRHH